MTTSEGMFDTATTDGSLVAESLAGASSNYFLALQAI